MSLTQIAFETDAERQALMRDISNDTLPDVIKRGSVQGILLNIPFHVLLNPHLALS